MSGYLRIYIELRGHGARGPRYQARMNKLDGMVIVESSTEPLLDAARVLLSKGVTGRLEMWDRARPFPRLCGDIEQLAKLTVSEGHAAIGLRRYSERPASGDFEDEPSQVAQVEIGRSGRVVQNGVGIPTPSAREAA